MEEGGEGTAYSARLRFGTAKRIMKRLHPTRLAESRMSEHYNMRVRTLGTSESSRNQGKKNFVS